MTNQTRSSHLVSGLKRSITVLSLLAYGVAAIAAGAAWVGSSSAMLGGLTGDGVATIELEPSLLSAQGLEQ